MTRRFRYRRLASLATLAVAAVAGTTAYAFTSSNTLTAHDAGIGLATVSGYSTTGAPTYTWNATDGTLRSVELVVDKAASDLQVAIVDHSTAPVAADYKDCVDQNAGTDTDWLCDWGNAGLPGITSATSSDFYFAAVSSGSVHIH